MHLNRYLLDQLSDVKATNFSVATEIALIQDGCVMVMMTAVICQMKEDAESVHHCPLCCD